MFVIGMILFGSMLLVAIFAPLIAPHTYDEQNMAMKLSAPSSEYPLGTDQYLSLIHIYNCSNIKVK